MKTFKQYLTELKERLHLPYQTYQSRLITNSDPTQRHLGKYEVKSVQAPKRLMLQSAPTISHRHVDMKSL